MEDNRFVIRNRKISETSAIGIAVNIALVIIKAVFGLIAGSIAMLLDALNNLTDVVSSVITIIGLKLSEKRPDEDHPMGHGRIEYISAVIVAVIIIYAGATAGIESVKKIINPIDTKFTFYTVLILMITIAAKCFLGTFVMMRGRELKSPALVASGQDAINDCVVSVAVLLSALLAIFLNIHIDAFVSLFISFWIVKAGFELLIDDMKDILGRRADRELARNIKEYIGRFNDVLDVHDLVLHNYGPDRFIGSVVIDVDSNMTANNIYTITHYIKDEILEAYNVILSAIGICVVDSETNDMREEIIRRLEHIDGILQVHGIHIDKDKKIIDLDIIIAFDSPYPDAIIDHARMHLTESYPEYTIDIHNDSDM
ncbi:cation diffusion facilitator family transporter [Butyrivibrio sp. JL13D10]|uniref:cation diffusion facilitator family transporter n=1 Tax=Butyrivibrio sp. JL13D10 TaxID=3236815 RepID=UPI0038B559ED